MTLSIPQIEESTNRLPFNRKEKDAAFHFLKTSRSKGRDLCIGSEVVGTSGEERLHLVEDGIFIFSSPVLLRAAFLFVKIDAGRGFCGAQKAAYQSYLGEVDRDEWQIGSLFRQWAIAITSIGNVYRHEGIG